ncbi:hypothetical protein [Psychrobacter sp. UBA6291]|uniref:hypothetical protein n=1 Tax=Psychrobacter sp. UBA6291 TaxID=1947357 RepID=UPI00257F874B|nr:hypothetical protein [Psychrobacter sp. UBA6291]
MHIGIAGEVRCVVTGIDGAAKIDTGFQKNLILNQGLDFFGGGKGSFINERCAIGSGNSTPTITQTKLDAFLALASGSDTTSDYSYVDEGDGLYKMWEQKKYRFTGLDNVNISELGLVSTGSTSENYFLTTRVLIKDSSGTPTSIGLKLGETLDIYYKIHKVVDITDKSFVINILDGNGGSVPYNAIIRAQDVGSSYNKVSETGSSFGIHTSTSDLSLITSSGDNSGSYAASFSNYVTGSYKVQANLALGLDQSNKPIRTIKNRIVNYSYALFPFQMRLGRVSDDAPLTKTNKDTLSIPLEFSWGRYEGNL